MACIFYSYAHPDDESFLAAGASCRYAAEGADVVLATATLGQAGRRGDPPLCGREELPGRRRSELREACRLLDIGTCEVFGYRDKELGQAPPEEMRERLVKLMRRHRPEVVATFDPNGLNAHADHIAISRFTSDAVAAAADPRYGEGLGDPHRVQRLLWTPFQPPWDVPSPDPPWPEQPGADFILDIRPYAERKVAALKAHRTQWPSIRRCFFEGGDERKFESEVFRQAWGPPLRQRPCPDLFAGIRSGEGSDVEC